MNDYGLIKGVAKGVGVILLACMGALSAAYALRESSGWVFASACVLVVGCSIPMVRFFNLFAAPNEPSKSQARFVRMHEEEPTPWSELFESNRTETRDDD